MANYTAIDEAIAMFEGMDKDSRFSMDQWTHTCGAPSCIAGYLVSSKLPHTFARLNAIIHAKKSFEELLEADLITSAVYKKLFANLAGMTQTQFGSSLGDLDEVFPNKAEEIFGIDDGYGREIFWPGGDCWQGLNGSKPKHAVKALKRLKKMLKEDEEEETHDIVSDDAVGMSLTA